jgi:histone acetyltransferase (RNA polymerase elongator complex component)
MILPVFLPHLGCKTRCIYCNQDYITKEFSADTVADRIARLFGNVKQPVEVALYGGNPLGLDVSALRCLFSLFDPFANNISGFRLSAKPGQISRELVNVLKSYHVHTIELGVPNFNDVILGLLNRGHNAAEAVSSFTMLTQEGFKTGIQFMVCLPGECIEDLVECVHMMKELKPSFVRIYPLLVIKDTRLYQLYINGDFSPDSLDEAVWKTSILYTSCWNLNIPVIKMGLTENEVLKDKIASGPFHPAFGYIVKSEVFRRAVQGVCALTGMTGNVKIHLGSSDIPHLIGFKRSNIDKLNQAGISLEWLMNNEIQTGHFKVEAQNAIVEGDLSYAIPVLLS